MKKGSSTVLLSMVSASIASQYGYGYPPLYFFHQGGDRHHHQQHQQPLQPPSIDIPPSGQSRSNLTDQDGIVAIGRKVPLNVQKFYEMAKLTECHYPASEMLAHGFQNSDGSPPIVNYCTNKNRDILFLSGPKGHLANLDVDCDGDTSGGDGRCSNDQTGQSETAFQDELRSYRQGVRELNPNFIPYVVLGNDNGGTFDPLKFGIEPLSLVVVVCNNKLIYGIWGDTCGADQPLVGEGSLALATACYGNRMTGNSGHDEDDVLFVAFTGQEAVPGRNARWGARSFKEFEDSIVELGNKLIDRLQM